MRSSGGLLGPEIVYLRPPLLPSDLDPLPKTCRWVQFDHALSSHEYVALGRFLEAYPNVTLRAYFRPPEIRDLRFLEHFPRLRRFHADLWLLERLDGIESLPVDLEYLGLGATRRRIDLAPLGRFRALREIFLEGHSKRLDVLQALDRIEKVTLRSIMLPDLSVLSSMSQLWWLDLKLGGTTELGLVPTFTRLKYLELWMIRGLTELSFLAETRSLQYVFLQALRRVEEIPSLADLAHLRKVHVETMKGLKTLDRVAHAPALEELVVLDMPQLTVDDFRPFRSHARLRAATVAIGSARKNKSITELLGLPPAGGKRDFRFE